MEYQLCPNNLEQLIQFGFKINWTLLQIGYLGNNFIPPQLTQEDLVKYALERLETIQDDLIAMLVCSVDDCYEFEHILGKLAKNENVSQEMQIRKLRVLIVFRNLKTISDDYTKSGDYTKGLIELTEMWVSLGLPDDCPHVVQGRSNSLSPEAYYTKAMYEALQKKNFDWLENEISYIAFKDRISA